MVFEKFVAILLRPRVFFAEVKKETSLSDALKYFLAATIVLFLLSGIELIIRYPQSTINATVVGITVAIWVAQLIPIVIFAAISQVLGRLFFGAAGSHHDTLRVYLYQNLTGRILLGIGSLALAFLPDLALPIVIIGLVLSLYLIYVLTIGLSIVHEISMLKAFIMGIPGIIIIALAISATAKRVAYL